MTKDREIPENNTTPTEIDSSSVCDIDTVKVILSESVDESLIGGLIVQVCSTMIDTSIKNKLQQIENKMMKV